MRQRFLAVYEHRKEGYSGFVPDLPGCIATGVALEEMQANMRETMNAHVSGLAERGEAIPEPTTHIVHFPHPSEGHGIDHWIVEGLEAPVQESGRGQTELKLKAGSLPAS